MRPVVSRTALRGGVGRVAELVAALAPGGAAADARALELPAAPVVSPGLVAVLVAPPTALVLPAGDMVACVEVPVAARLSDLPGDGDAQPAAATRSSAAIQRTWDTDREEGIMVCGGGGVDGGMRERRRTGEGGEGGEAARVLAARRSLTVQWVLRRLAEESGALSRIAPLRVSTTPGRGSGRSQPPPAITRVVLALALARTLPPGIA